MTTANMTQTRQKQKHTIWYLLVICLIIGVVTWWWFTQRIEKIEQQIELHESQ